MLRHLGNRLDAYLRDRARVEGIGYALTPEFFIRAFRGGVRMMFGVDICDHGEMLGDDQEPYPGYFEAWMEARPLVTGRQLLHDDAVPLPRKPTSEAQALAVRAKDALARDELLNSIRAGARRLIAASWVCDSVAPTITAFVEDLRSGYSTHDLPIDDLRAASLAAGELAAICGLRGWSIEDALAQVFVRDELFYDREIGK